MAILLVVLLLIATVCSQDFNNVTTLKIKSGEIGDCFRKSQCVSLPVNATCFGTRLPYSNVSFSTSGLSNYWDVQDKLKAWSALKFVPKCWTVIQPLLCSVYLPRCDEDKVAKLAHQLCRVTRGPCRAVHSQGWPLFLQCNNTQIYTRSKDEKCKVSKRILKFNTTAGKCMQPYLVKVKEPLAHYGDVDECGLACQDAMFSQQEHGTTHGLIRVAGFICLFFNMTAFLTFVIHWTNSNSSSGSNMVPNKIICYMNACFALVSLGMLAQFLTENARQDIVCRSDGSKRIAEPGAGENFSCVTVFVLVYYFETAFDIWLVLLTYTWSVTFKSWGKVTLDRENLERRMPYFHIVAWSVPLILTISIIFFNGIDGHSLTGICQVSHYTRSTTNGSAFDGTLMAWFVLVPYGVTFLTAALFVAKIFYFLCNVSKSASQKASQEIRSTQAHIGVLIVPMATCKLFSLLHHVYMLLNVPSWDMSLRDFLVCQARSQGDHNEVCVLASKPNLQSIHLQLLCFFMPGILSAILVASRAAVRTWRDFLCKRIVQHCLHFDAAQVNKNNKGIIRQKVKKHKLIAQAYARRHEFRDVGRLSLTLNSVHDDVPVVAVNANAIPDGSGDSDSEDLSSTWAQALPRLVERRNALTGHEQLQLYRTASVDSDLSVLSRSYSIHMNRYSWVDSRRQSLGGGDCNNSQFSMHQSELDHLESIYNSALKHKSRKKFFSKKMQKSFKRSISSLTSQENNSLQNNSAVITLDPAKLQASFNNKNKKYILPPPGKSIDVQQQSVIQHNNGNHQPFAAGTDFMELEEKLKMLHSRTSHETLLTDSRNINVVNNTGGDNDDNDVVNRSVLVQTSLTDLAGLQRKPSLREAFTQCSPLLVDNKKFEFKTDTTNTTTTSSSQTESHLLLNNRLKHRQHPIDAHVTQIHVHHESSEDSSIPSSYDRDYEGKKFQQLRQQLNLMEPPMPPPPFPLQIPVMGHSSGMIHHNRARRGGLVDTDNKIIAAVQQSSSPPVVHTLDEMEIKVRTPQNKYQQQPTMQQMESIAAISTPSS